MQISREARHHLALIAGAAGLAALFAGAFIVSLTPVSDGDIFWHMAAGREMLHRRAWLRSDPFTLSAAGRPWVDVHWLFQLVVYGIHRAAGLAGLVVAKALVVGAGALILAGTVGRSGGRAARALFAPALLGALFVARQYLLVRPVIVTLLMLALFFAALESLRAGRRRPALVLLPLPLLQLVWSNCQGLAALGPAMIGAYLVAALLGRLAGEERRWPFQSERALPWRPLAAALALCVAASFVTPYGAGGAFLPGRLLARLAPAADNVFAAQVAENVPPFALERIAPAQISHFKWYLVALAACLALAGRRLYLSHVAIIVGFVALALIANRNLLLLYWIATPIAILAVTPRLRGLAAARPAAAGVALSVVGVALLGELALAAVAARRESTIALPTPFHFPTESARRLAGAGAAGPLFAPDHCGGYLTFTAPALRPFIDTRLMLHTGAEYADFLAATSSGALFDALAERQRFRYVVLTTAYPDRYLGLVQHLAASSGWRMVFTDGSEVLFARPDDPLPLAGAAAEPTPLTAEALLPPLAARFGRWPGQHEAARFNLARLLIVLGETGEAQKVLQTLDGRAAVQLRARAHLVAGEPAAAESLARTLLLGDANDVNSLTLLAQLAAMAGHPQQALDWLRRALAADPYDPEARRLLDQLTKVP